ncbi:MAG: alpha/beta hydrolase [Verrucomicrobiaceae bacterium]|nr:alpha/beta hydrolase [Verrucomicrobiaceae bacterium]
MNSAITEFSYPAADGLTLFCRDFQTARSNAPTILCLHGLTRNSRDFIELARHLQRDYRVLAPDVRGRGRSTYDPIWQNYHPLTYVNDVWVLLDFLRIDKIIVIGTSMGALMGMLLGSQQPQRIAGLVLNDAGPELDPVGLARIAKYAGKIPPVHNWQEATAQVRSIFEHALPGLSDEQWLAYTKQSFREREDGVPIADSDPKIGDALRAAATAPQNIWPVFAQLTQIPILVIRGEHSDILSAQTVERMAGENPNLQQLIVANRGHAPLLNEPECLAGIDGFLAAISR